MRIRSCTSPSSPAVRASMPCTNPTEGAVPVSDSSSATTRCAGTNCTTIRYTANAARFGPYPTGPGRAPSGRAAVWIRPQPHTHPVLVVLGDRHGDLRDLVLLVAVDHAQIPRAGQVVAAVAAALREPVAPLVAGRRSTPDATPAPRAACPATASAHPGRAASPAPRGLPGSSSRDGGLEELPELRDSRCSNRASLAASASLASISSASCPAWRATTTISSSRDISSGSGTGRSNRTQPITL